VHCRDDGYFPAINSKIHRLTAHRFDQYMGRHVHLVAIVYEDLPNEVFIYDPEDKDHSETLKPIIFSKEPYEGVVTNIEFIGPFLAVLLRHSK
jgi:hypothetical protein